MTIPSTGRKSGSPGYAARRAALIGKIADALLAAGLAEIPLRELAAQVGTSDRMLLYYFAGKSDLVKSSLAEVSARLARLLGVKLQAKTTPAEAVVEAMPLFASQAVSPFMSIWADVSARGSRGEEPYRAAARDSVHGWLAWLEQRLDVAAGPTRQQLAAAVLTVLEGARLLETFIPGSSREAVALLANGLPGKRARNRRQAR